jgi:hypothetical protein
VTVRIRTRGKTWAYFRLTDDFSTSLATAVAVGGFGFTPFPHKTYAVEGCFLLRTNTTTVGARPGVSWPTGLADGAAWITAPNSYTAFASRFIPSGAAASAAGTGLASTTASHLGTLWATIVTGESVSGAFQITLASETAGTTVTMKAGSWIRYILI